MANKTFATYLSELSAVTSLGAGDKLPVLESSTVKYVDGGDIGGTSYLKYVALLSQTGTNAPVATVLENTLGGAVVFSYEEEGAYIGTLAAAFTENKIVFFLGSIDSADTFVKAEWIDTDSFRILSFNTGTQADDELDATAIEIRVYP